MSAAARDAAKLVRLRGIRLNAARTVLGQARDATLCAVEAVAARVSDEHAALDATLAERRALAADPGEAALRLAVIDQCRFSEAVAAERRLDAERAESEARYREDLARVDVIRAHRRHGAMEDHAATLHRAAATLAEEREAIETESMRAR